MTANPFESIENKLHFLQTQIGMLAGLVKESMKATNGCPPVERTEGIDCAVEVTGLAKGTIYNLVAERNIPHYKRGKRIYFSRHELQNWIKEGRRMTKDQLGMMYQTRSL